jgi:hypothetical protein
MHCVAVERGVREKILARCLSDPTGAGERNDQRSTVRIDGTSRVLRSASGMSTGRAVPVVITDVSLTGAAIETRLEMAPGDVVALKRGDGQEVPYLVVRRDLQNRDRYGLKALDAQQGATFCSTIVGDAAEIRNAQREEQLKQARKEQAREAAANAPKKDQNERFKGMWTRIEDEED